VLIAALALIVVAFAAVSLWFWQAGRLRWRSWLGSAALVAWVVGVGVKVHFDRAPQASSLAVRAVPSIAWPVEDSPGTGAATTPETSSQAGKQVGSVPSLIGGLERRLAEQPNDAAGWALLAQSYAFLGDTAAADAALRKAADLGMDEATLRARVDGATRNRVPR
jgi:cytochrome c-type biogenesis protein CcmH/NrfG